MEQPKAKYPQIYCSVHGVEPLYLVCDHVINGAHASYLFRATETDEGDAICEDCRTRIVAGTPDDDSLHTVCVSAADKLLGGRLAQMLTEREKEAEEYRKAAATQ